MLINAILKTQKRTHAQRIQCFVATDETQYRMNQRF